MSRKKEILLIIAAAIALLVISIEIIPSTLNPLRRSNGSIRASVLKSTPLGSSRQDVQTAIEREGWHLNHQYTEPEFKNQLRARLGTYTTFFDTHVNAVWLFDSGERLTNTWVYKGVAGF